MTVKVNNSLKKESMYLGLKMSSLINLVFAFILLLSVSAALGVFFSANMTYLIVGSLVGTLATYVLLRIQEQRYAPHHLLRLLSYRFFQPKRI